MLPGIFLILQDPDQYLYHVQQASLLLCCSLLCMTFVAIIDDSSTLAITLAIASAGFSLWVIVPVVAMARIAFSNPGTPIDTSSLSIKRVMAFFAVMLTVMAMFMFTAFADTFFGDISQSVKCVLPLAISFLLSAMFLQCSRTYIFGTLLADK